jgi:hypothetical protein
LSSNQSISKQRLIELQYESSCAERMATTNFQQLEYGGNMT